MSSHISYRNLTPIIISGQFWILVQTYMYFAVISAMQTQATSGCKSLAKYFGSVVDFSTWCLVHWNAEVLPTSGFDQSCFADRSRFIYRAHTCMDTSPRVLVVSTLTDGNLCSSQCERRRNAGVFNFNFLFSRKLLYC